MTKERVGFLIQFDEYVRNNVTDENYFDYWLENGIPDGADVDTLKEIAEDDELWIGVINTFAYVVECGEPAK